MPREVLSGDVEGAAPKLAHFAVMVGDGTQPVSLGKGKGLAIPLGPGSQWLLVDPKEGSPIPLVLKEVSVNRIVFQLQGVDYTYSLSANGKARQQAFQRIAAQRRK